jgi:hypothetical protein
MSAFSKPDASVDYRRVYLVESRDWWPACRGSFDATRDVVFTYDFALRREIQEQGGRAFYLDYLVAPEEAEANNHNAYAFFRDWHRDAAGNDLFAFRGIPFGFALRIDIWNDLIFTTRARACLQKILQLKFESLHVGTRLGLVEKMLGRSQRAFTKVAAPADDETGYFFPIHRWMDQKVRSRKFRHRIKPWLAQLASHARGISRRIASRAAPPPAVFVQEYHPTRAILQALQRDPAVRVVLARYSATPGLRKFFTETAIPERANPARHRAAARAILETYRSGRAARLVLADGSDCTADVLEAIEPRVESELCAVLDALDSVLDFVDRNPLRLEIMISNIGRLQSLVHCVCEQRGVPSFLIINGMLVHAYLDEARYASVINAYSESIRANYFRGMSSIVCLGDPRMDAYAVAPVRTLNRAAPTFTIGASGHNITNLGSYVAVEFEFLNDVLQAFARVKIRGVPLRVIIKVRDNGYRSQYEAFTREYFPGLVDEIIEGQPMRSVLQRSDFYVSIYSQTLLEASCLGIPALYYKKDTETLFAPFDGKSELVTVGTVDALVAAIDDFLGGGARFAPFLERAVLEKYIGFLDGGNLGRHLDFIASLLAAPARSAA